MLEKGAPTRLVAPREIEIGAGKRKERVGRIGRLQRHVERLSQPLERQKVDPENELVEVVESRVDRAERASRLGREVARLKPCQPAGGDGLAGDVEEALT